MASLQDRIQHAAREAVASALSGSEAVDSAPTRAQLQQQITDLHEHLHHAATTIKRLEDRVEALEKAAAGDEPSEPLPRRTTRKRAES